MKNILVVKLSAIGDVIHALPVSYAIKETYPDAHLTWVVEPTAYPILEDNPYIDDIIVFEKAKFRSLGGFLHAIGPLRRRLRRRRYDASLDLQGLFKSAAIVLNARVKRRIGTANMREGANLVSRPVKGAHAHGHIVERYLDVARALGCRVDEVRFPVAVSARDANAAEIVLAREEHFAALSDRLYRAHYIPVLVGGGRLDETLAQDIMAAVEIPPINLVGRTNLKQLAHIFTRASLVLGGDTGPVHLAAGLGTPTVMLMGPTDTNRNGPYGQLENAIEVDRRCRACWKRACPKGFDCLAIITPEEVIAKMRPLLQKR